MTESTAPAQRRESDSGYKPLPIGTPSHPWPTMERGEDNGVRTIGLGVIQSDTDPLWLHSAREYKDVMPELLRDMPVPGMLDAFEAVLNHPLVYLQSDPAYGKSYLANLIGNAMHSEGAIIYDAGGKNLESLLFETVFDANASSDLIDRINGALREGTLTEPSLKALRELKDQNDKPLLSEEGNKKVFDWISLRDSKITREQLDAVLSSVQKYQEWNGGLRIGFKDVPGALIRAAKEHRPLVIDEFARRKPGSEAALQQVWQVINGEIDHLTIPLGNLGSFTLHHGDIPKVIMTSNRPKDGVDVHPIAESLRTRLVIKDIPSFTQDDWAHRISQVLTGVPTTTLARLEKGHMLEGATLEDAKWIVANGDRFKRNLESIRTTGVTAVPPLQTKLLEHWEEVNDASKALARAFHQSAELLDPDSLLLQQPSMADIRFEVDKPGDRANSMTPREALRMLRQSIQRTAQSTPATQTAGADFTSWDAPHISPSEEPIEAKMGDRLKKLVERWIDETAGVTVDGAKRPKLYEQLKAVWTEAGIIGNNSILDQLNIKNRHVELMSEEVQQAKAIIDNFIRQQYPDYEGITQQSVETFLKNLNKTTPVQVAEETLQMQVLSDDPDNLSRAKFSEASAAITRTTNTNRPGGKDFADFIGQHPSAGLVEQDKIISTLALPFLDKALLQSVSKLPDGTVETSPANYAGNSPNTITTAIAQKDGQYSKLHILHNKEDGATLVITFQASTVRPPNQNLTVINAGDSNAAHKIDLWLKAHAQDNVSALRTAFDVRNAVPETMENEPLAKLLVSTDVRAFSPVIVSKNTPAVGRA